MDGTATTARGIHLLDSAWYRAEALIPHLRETRKGGRVTRSDVLREAIDRGLRDLEFERAKAER